jgi:hypothetical protein
MPNQPFHGIFGKAWACIALSTLTAAFWSAPANAVPAFADQTGQPCSSCHVGGFGPQLTAFGRAFKLSGYTLRTVDSTIPVSAMAVVSFLHTSSDQSAPPAPHYGVNDNATVDQVNLFVAGGINDNFGGFSQFTYDGVGRAFSWDNLDLRATDAVTLDGTDVQIGLSINNNPTVQDSWNTLSAWGFPYTDSALAPAPGAATVLNGGLAQSTLGVTAYAWWDSQIYTEGGFYVTPGQNFLSAMGALGGAVLKGTAPYARVAYQKDYGEQNFELGAIAFLPSLYPGGDRTATDSDKYQDLGVDGSYQYAGDGTNIYQINLRYTHEQQKLDASFALGAAAQPGNSLNEFQADASYYWHNEIGGTVEYFNVTGSADSQLYAANRTLNPDSAGLLFQIDGTPFGETASDLGTRVNLRLGMQYRLFTRFNGAATNFDGAGSNASDNDTLRLFAWVAL